MCLIGDIRSIKSICDRKRQHLTIPKLALLGLETTVDAVPVKEELIVHQVIFLNKIHYRLVGLRLAMQVG